MEFEELEKLFKFLDKMSFVEQVSRKDQIKYDKAFEELKKKVEIRNKFIVEAKSFKNVIFGAFKNGAKYLKVHLIEDDLGVNIGLSFCKEGVQENGTVDNDLEFFWTINNNQLVATKRNDFKEYKTRFNTTTLLSVNVHTKKMNTEYVKFDIDDVLRYIIKNLLSNVFVIKGIMFNQFIFKDYDNVDIKKNDRIGISVHTLLEEVQDPIEEVSNHIEKNTDTSVVSIGYDFGTVYP